MDALSRIPGISTLSTDKSVLVTADGYRVMVIKHEHPHAADKRYRTRWLFDESMSDAPSMASHFALRKQIHEALNGH